MNKTPGTMHLGQVIITSGGPESNHENKVVACSAGVSDERIETIRCWSPDRSGLAYGMSESINFFRLDRGTFALSRSVVGGLACRRNPGRQIVSHAVVIRREQLEGYDNNAALLARVLLSLGVLILRTSDSYELPLLEVPDYGLDRSEFLQQFNSPVDNDRITHAIDVHEKVVILGVPDPVAFLGGLLAVTESSKRLDISFATGLEVLENRTFTLQFFEDPDPVLAQDLARAQHRTISLNSEKSPFTSGSAL